MVDIQHPMLCSTKPLQKEYSEHTVIKIKSEKFTIGRSLTNAEVIACVAISRFHCILEQHSDLSWSIRDTSRYGTFLNGSKMKKDENVKLKDQDVIQFDIAGDFIYKFCVGNAEFVASRKRKYSDTCDQDADSRIRGVNNKCNSTLSIEMDNIKTKLEIAQKNHFNIVNEKASLEKNLQDKISNLECFYNQKILDLKGRKDEIQQQKVILMKQSDEEKNKLLAEMNRKITFLEVTLLEKKLYEKSLEEENKLLVERLKREHDEFQQRLEEVTHSKEQKLGCLENQLHQKEQELKDEKNRIVSLVQFTEHLKTEKEELTKHLAEQVQMESAKKAAEQQLEQQRKFMEMCLREKEEEKQKLQKLLMEKSRQSDLDLQNLQRDLAERESKLQEQAEKDKECLTSLLAKENETCNSVIKRMQEELQKVKSKIIIADNVNENKSATREPSAIIDLTTMDGPSTSSYSNRVWVAHEEKAHVLNNVNNIMESELQCSICSDLFIEATTLNCSHTFCKHCITMWMKKKLECPFCRAKITSECHSIVLDSFIDKMLESMDADVKTKRAQTLKERQKMANLMTTTSGCSSGHSSRSSSSLSNGYSESFSVSDNSFEYSSFSYGFHRGNIDEWSDFESYIASDSYSSSEE